MSAFFSRIIDKLVFGAALIIALQLPQLADHYQQHLSGMYEATKWQVDGYKSTAKSHDFVDVRAMIDAHMQNQDLSVRADAEQKLTTLVVFDDLSAGMTVFEKGSLFQKLGYMFNVSRYSLLETTVSNFKLGIPITLSGLAFGVVMGLILNTIIMLPFNLWATRRKRNKKIVKPIQET